MDKKLNGIHESLMPTKLKFNNNMVQYIILQHNKIQNHLITGHPS